MRERIMDEEITLTCPCHVRGLRCGDCVMVVFFGPPRFRDTPVGHIAARIRHPRIKPLFPSD
jgi:hypothetical protein